MSKAVIQYDPNDDLLNIPNCYDTFKKKNKVRNPGYDRHLIKLPFYMGVIGGSGSGKGVFLHDLLKRMNNTFNEVIICCRDKNEPIYEDFEEKGQGDIIFHENKVPHVDTFLTNEADPHDKWAGTSKAKPPKQRLIIFDDLILDKSLSPLIAEYFIRARKKNISCIYIGQSYYGIPKLIRQQLGYLILKRFGSKKDINAIMREFSLTIKKEDFLRLYDACVQDLTNFLMFDNINYEYKHRFCFKPLSIEDQ